jgi:(p)ppGpp synthase/HD superfamily hydrolase
MKSKNQVRNQNKLLAKMVKIVTNAYIGKLDNNNKALILQPIKIMMKLAREDVETRIIAIAKDLLKESDYTLSGLREEGFSERVVLAIDLLDQKRGDDFQSYINKVSFNKDTSLVKKFDLKYSVPQKNRDILNLMKFSENDALAFLTNEMPNNKELSVKLSEMIAIAADAHESQCDKGGNAYILHPFRIMMSLTNEDIEVQIMAVAHDVVEDSKGRFTISILRDMHFSERVLTGLTLLTHLVGVLYQKYIVDISKNKDAKKVKKADICDNSNVTRLKGVSYKDQIRNQKYNFSYWFLDDKIEEEEYLIKIEELFKEI